MNVRKTLNAERYDIHLGRNGWAIIVIDEMSGFFATVSDYGNWSHVWPHHGRESFKHFLVEISKDPDYFMKKVAGGRREWDEEATHKRVRGDLLRHRREGNCTKKEARTLWKKILFMEDEGFDKQGYANQLYEDGIADNLYSDGEIPIVNTFPSDLKQFSKLVYPIFVDTLRKELSQPKPPAETI